MNKIILIGRMVRDPEMKEFESGSMLATFTLAVDRTFKKKDGTKETDFINCQAWGKTGEILSKYTAKGSKVATVGRLQIRTYDDKDGNRKWTTEVVVDEFEFLDSKKDSQAPASDNPLDDEDFHLMADSDDVPF